MQNLRKLLEKKRRSDHRGLHTAIIPGTGKIRTSIPGANQYSKESDLENITRKQYRAAGAKKKI